MFYIILANELLIEIIIIYLAFCFFSSQGARVSRALSEAQQTVQTTKHFAHPANWAGFLLVGADVKLSNKVREPSK